MRRSMTNLFTGLREGWSLAKPYFSSDEKWSAIGLLASIILLNLILTELNVVFTYWTRFTYNALQNKDAATFWKLIFLYSTGFRRFRISSSAMWDMRPSSRWSRFTPCT